MKEYFLRIKEWWLHLAEREKKIVTIGGLLVSGFLFYQLMLMPLTESTRKFRHQIEVSQKLLTWMQAADNQLKQVANKQQKENTIMTTFSLLSMLQTKISEADLTKYLMQLKQTDNDEVSMHFQDVAFDTLATLLLEISKETNITIIQMSAAASANLGLVSADILLKLN